jgi:hypothetical protein
LAVVVVAVDSASAADIIVIVMEMMMMVVVVVVVVIVIVMTNNFTHIFLSLSLSFSYNNYCIFNKIILLQAVKEELALFIVRLSAKLSKICKRSKALRTELYIYIRAKEEC